MKYFICPKCGEMLDVKLIASFLGKQSWEKNKVTATARLVAHSKKAVEKRWEGKRKP